MVLIGLPFSVYPLKVTSPCLVYKFLVYSNTFYTSYNSLTPLQISFIIFKLDKAFTNIASAYNM